MPGQGRLDVVELALIEAERLFNKDVLPVPQCLDHLAVMAVVVSRESRRSRLTDPPAPLPRRSSAWHSETAGRPSASFSGDKSHSATSWPIGPAGVNLGHVGRRHPTRSPRRPIASRPHLRRGQRAAKRRCVTQPQHVVQRILPNGGGSSLRRCAPRIRTAPACRPQGARRGAASHWQIDDAELLGVPIEIARHMLAVAGIAELARDPLETSRAAPLPTDMPAG